MPQSFEKYFTQKEETQKEEEKEKSPEQIKEEKALLLAEEIKEIRERMAKEGKTIEGYQRIIELAQKIEEIYKEKREFISEEAKEIYQSLKETPLWDEGKKQWNWYMNEEGELRDSFRYSRAQLLGVLAEAVTGNLDEAKEIYQSLKKTSLCDEEKKQWNGVMNEGGKLEDSDRYSADQLLGVLAEAVTGNLDEAKEIYQSLKKTSLWDEGKKQWNWYMNEEGELEDSFRHSVAQLLGVLAEAVTGNLDEAKEIYQSLKKTPLWDKGKKQWNWYMNEEGKMKNSLRQSAAQLLGVLAEAVDEKGEEFVEFLTKGNK